MPAAALALDDRILNAKRLVTLNYYREEFVKAMRNLGSIVRRCRDDKEQPWLAAGYESFEAFALAEWGIGPKRIYQLCAGEGVRDLLAADAATAEIAPRLKEGQLREIAKVDPPKRVEVLKAALKDNPKLTAKSIRQATGRVIESVEPPAAPAPKAKPHKCPTCGQTIP